MAPHGRLRKVRDVIWRAACSLLAAGLAVIGLVNVGAFALDVASDHSADWASLALGALFTVLALGAVWLARHPELGDS
jgi:hypothetical protein